jgi:solute carrier family 39 (zinc transporter), member 1/2/3
LILLAALGIHSILEMMALGLTNSFSDGALLTLSIALHQPAESIALLVAFLKSGMPKSQILQYLSIFACMGPIGVALGMAVNEYAAPVVDSIMLSIVAGTFVYVGATEVIPEEWEDSTHKWKKFAALMSGIVIILCITQYTMSFHSH